MDFRLIDSHAHVQFPAFNDDREDVIARALESKVGIITVGTKFATSKSALELAQKYPKLVWATVGFHPLHIEQSYHDKNEEAGLEKEEFDYKKMLELSRSLKAVGIGECGLDYYRIKNSESPHQNEFGTGQVGIKEKLNWRTKLKNHL